MHVCIFPQLHNPAPIYGFDIIAGENKITGAFHDFSPSVDTDHDMIKDYYKSVEHFVPNKQRELPEWAKNIFTKKMLAAGNVRAENEVTEIIRIAIDNMYTYFEQVGLYDKKGQYVMVNKKYETSYLMSRKDIIGKRLKDVLHEDLTRKLLNIVENA